MYGKPMNSLDKHAVMYTVTHLLICMRHAAIQTSAQFFTIPNCVVIFFKLIYMSASFMSLCIVILRLTVQSMVSFVPGVDNRYDDQVYCYYLSVKDCLLLLLKIG